MGGRLARVAALGVAVVALVLLLGYGAHRVLAARAEPPSTAASATTPARSTQPNDVALNRAIREHAPITVMGIGSSVGVGAELPDPSTQSPVGRLARLLQTRFPDEQVRTSNYSVNGSTTFDGLKVYTEQVRPHRPTVLLIAFGMNDGQTPQYNSGETLPGSMAALREIVRTARLDGTTVLVATTPSPDTEGNDFSLPAGLPVSHPTPGGPLEPDADHAVTTIDGQPFSARHAIWNDAARRLAREEGATVIDAARYWPAAVREHGERSLFNVQNGPSDVGRFVHPNLLGHQRSYWLAEDDFVRRLAPSS